MKLLFPLLLAVTGIAAGSGAGLMLRPTPEDTMATTAPCGVDPNAPPVLQISHQHNPTKNPAVEYVKLNNQFVVPVVEDDLVRSLVLLSLSLEVESGHKEDVFSHEPKLRDALLQAMFDHANLGGFNGAFTNSSNLDSLKVGLLETARNTLGDFVQDILIIDIARQEV